MDKKKINLIVKLNISVLLLICMLTFVSAISNTSYQGVGFDIPDVTFSSDTYVTLSEIQFNSSELITNYAVLSSFNVNKLTGSLSSDIYVKVSVDGIEIIEERVRSLSDKLQPGSTGIKPFSFNVSNGNHTILIETKRTGSGAIQIYNIDFFIGKFISTLGNEGRGNLTDISTSFLSLTPINIWNKTITKNVNSSIFLATKLNFYSDTGSDIVICNFQNGGYSPDIIIELEDINSVKSTAMNYITGPEYLIENISLICYSENGENIIIEGSLIEIDMRDDLNNPINNYFYTNPLTNYSNPIILTGTSIISEINFTPLNGTNVLFSTFGSFKSNSGEQTPYVDIYVKNSSDDTVCNSTQERYTSGDIGSLFFYDLCTELEINNNYTFYGEVHVPVGGEITFYDGGVSYFENSPFDISVINSPPVVGIINPVEGIVSREDTINWSITDSQSDRTLTNITLINGMNYTLGSNLLDNQSSLSVNYSDYTVGIYTLLIESCENETVDKLCGNSTFDIIVSPFNCGLTTGASILEVVPYYVGVDDNGLLRVSLVNSSGIYLNDSEVNASIRLDNASYQSMTYNATALEWYSTLTSSEEEDINVTVFFHSDLYACVQETYELKFREPFYLTIELYELNSSSRDSEQYVNDFHYIYLQKIETDTSSIPTTNQINEFFSSAYSWMPGIDNLYSSDNFDYDVVFWGKYSSGSALIKMYEAGNYDINLLTFKIDNGDNWEYEFFKPQYGDIVLDSTVTTYNLTLESNHTAKILADRWEFDKVSVFVNIAKTILIIIVAVIGLSMMALLPGGAKVIGAVVPVILLALFKYLGWI